MKIAYKDRIYDLPESSLFGGKEHHLIEKVFPLIDEITPYLENKEKSREKFIQELLNLPSSGQSFIDNSRINNEMIEDIVFKLYTIKKETEDSKRVYDITPETTELYLDNLLKGALKSANLKEDGSSKKSRGRRNNKSTED